MISYHRMASGSRRSRSQRNISAANVARTPTYEDDRADIPHADRPGSSTFYGHGRQRDSSR